MKIFLDTATPPQLSTDILLLSYFVIKTDAIQMSLQNICFLGEVMVPWTDNFEQYTSMQSDQDFTVSFLKIWTSKDIL